MCNIDYITVDILYIVTMSYVAYMLLNWYIFIMCENQVILFRGILVNSDVLLVPIYIYIYIYILCY